MAGCREVGGARGLEGDLLSGERSLQLDDAVGRLSRKCLAPHRRPRSVFLSLIPRQPRSCSWRFQLPVSARSHLAFPAEVGAPTEIY